MDLRSLPGELIVSIASYLDARSLTACCCVCSNWNEHINSNEILLRQVCINSDFVIKEDEELNNARQWKTYLVKREKRKRLFIKGLCFHLVTLNLGSIPIYAFYHYRGRIAAGYGDGRIRIWDCSSYTIVLDFYSGYAAKFIKFDDHLILAGGGGADFRTWDVTTGLLIRTYHAPQSVCTVLLDFSTESNMAVCHNLGPKTDFFNLSTGDYMLSLTCQVKYNRMLLSSVIPGDTASTIYLFTLDGLTARVFSILFTSNDRLTVILSIGYILQIQYKYHDSRMISHSISPNSYFDGRFVYFLESRPMDVSVIHTYDFMTNRMCNDVYLGYKGIKLLGVGRKYFAVAVQGNEYDISVYIIDRETKEAFSKWPVVGYTERELFYYGFLELVDMSVLDGLEEHSNNGVALIYIGMNKLCLYVWNRH